MVVAWAHYIQATRFDVRDVHQRNASTYLESALGYARAMLLGNAAVF